MKVVIISDMEGVAGICRWARVGGGKPLYDEGRQLYTEEINAAIRGAVTAGASDIVVLDHHGAGDDWSYNSLVPELLHPACEWVVLDHWTQYSAFLEDGCDRAVLIGMHARAGTLTGVLNHTVSTEAWQNVWFNDDLVGDTGINAALCGHWNRPVGLVTGDDATCEEARALLGDVPTVAVKHGLGRYSARHVPPVRARQLIEAATASALSGKTHVAPYRPGSPTRITVEFGTSDRVAEYVGKQGTTRTGPLTVVSEAGNWWSAWSQFFF